MSEPMLNPDFGDCTCPHAYKSLGKLYGISMGKGWVRLIDDPDCPEHGGGGGGGQ